MHVYAAATRRTPPIDPVADFTHMGLLVEAAMVLVVRAASRFQMLKQYVAAARTRPARYGTSGVGSANHLHGELLKVGGRAPNQDHVPYQGSAPAMQDLNGGQIDSVFDPITTNVATLEAGSLRALAVSTPRRLAALIPDVLATPDIAARLEDLQTLPGTPTLIGDEFVRLTRARIDAWRSVHVEVIG